MNTRQHTRVTVINKLVNSFRKIKEKDGEFAINKEATIDLIMGEHYVSRRTALEYLDAALARFENVLYTEKNELSQEEQDILEAARND